MGKQRKVLNETLANYWSEYRTQELTEFVVGDEAELGIVRIALLI